MAAAKNGGTWCRLRWLARQISPHSVVRHCTGKVLFDQHAAVHSDSPRQQGRAAVMATVL